MTKKLMLVWLAGILFAPAFAAEDKAVSAPADQRPVMAQKKGEFLKAQKEHRAKMKATEEKMEKLVKEYKKLKGKKQEAKKAEIAAEVEKIHAAQLKFQQAQLDKFAARLEEMKKHAQAAQTPEAKKAWVDDKTAALIEKDGDIKVLFDRPGHGPKDGPKMHGAKDGKGFFKGFKAHKGPKDGGAEEGGRVGLNPPPPPPLEEK